MKTRIINLQALRALAVATTLLLFGASTLAQHGNTNTKTDTKILYHNGPVMQGTSNVYVIWYGNWSSNTPGNNGWTQGIVVDFLINLGSSPYFQINHGYPDAYGVAPSGGLIYGGVITDESYLHGTELNSLAIQGIVADAIAANRLPQDPGAIYLVIGSWDINSPSTGFCTLNTPPHHGSASYGGSQYRYAFIGNPRRCPSVAAPQFNSGGPTPNDDFAADGMVSTIAHALAASVTNPTGTSWFDRYGLENAAKCQGTFGTIYTTSYNGARANMKLGQRDFLIQQNWVNNPRKGYCGLYQQ